MTRELESIRTHESQHFSAPNHHHSSLHPPLFPLHQRFISSSSQSAIMQFFSVLSTLVSLTALAAAQSAVIDSYSSSNCGSGYQGSFTVPSNGGECYGETSSQGIIVRSVSGGCTVTVYCDSSCSTCANVANLGDCRTGVSGYSIDC